MCRENVTLHGLQTVDVLWVRGRMQTTPAQTEPKQVREALSSFQMVIHLQPSFVQYPNEMKYGTN